MRILNLLSAILLVVPNLLWAQGPAKLSHQLQLEEYQNIGLENEADWDSYHRFSDVPATNLNRSGCNLQKVVYGWHPYWMGTAYNNYDWDNLSTFSYFSYEVNPNTGNYNSIHSWRTSNSINLAQANGVRVELCVTNFGGSNNSTFLTNPTARQTLIDSLISLLAFRNADGINIDFEGIPGSQRANFTSFMQDLSNQVKAARPGSSITMALYSVDWNNVFDILNLDPFVDQFIIMGYGYYYSGSANAGPPAPLYSGSTWFPYNLNRSVLYYLGEGLTPNKLILGLPYYGFEWSTVSNGIPSATTSYLSSRTYSYLKNNFEGSYPKTFDTASQSTAYIFQNASVWHQAWVDDEQSISEKMDLVLHRNIGGIGIWALGYDNGYSGLWNMIESKFSDCANPYCGDVLYDTGGPQGNYGDNEDYEFRIQSPAGESVTAEFPVFDLETGWDYLYIYDGPSTASPLIGQFDGNIAPGPFTSTGDALTFRFTSDNATNATGFELRWECDGPSTYQDTIRLNRNDSALIDCGLPYHVFYDSDAAASGNYNVNENNTMTFCSSNPARSLRMSFDMQTAPVQLDLKSTTSGNDYLSIWDGPDTNANLVALYTGSTAQYPQPGSIISSGNCLTARFESDNYLNGAGWQGSIRCISPPTDLGTSAASSLAPANFRDSGGLAANYGNNERFRQTFCPDATAIANNEVIWADFGAVELEQNYDYLHVHDGNDVSSPLIGTFTGNASQQNDLQVIKATELNPSGCLTFAFSSDGATTAAGWDASIQSGPGRKPYGADACSAATLINEAGVAYAGSTTLASGKPNGEDPVLNISLASLPECSGTNEITRLENSIWYYFTTPSTICPTSQIDLQLENIACQNSIPGGNGAQLVIYEVSSCQNGPSWGTPVYCSDKLLNSFPVNIASLLQPSSTYYILIDGFAGQHCNLDLILTGDITGCILPIELVDFQGEMSQGQVDLNWETQNESNNQGFFVQRTVQNRSGNLDFQDIGFVAALNGTNNNYNFSDPEFMRGQANFYRLRQLDFNGNSHFHKVIELRDAALGKVKVYPNPSQGRVSVGFGFLPEMGGDFVVYDVRGNKVWEMKWQSGEGQAVLDLDLGDLPTGIYLYRTQLDGQSVRGRLHLSR